MTTNLRDWLVRLFLVVTVLSMAACGGGDDGGEAVTGDSPEGVPIDELQSDDAGELEGEAIPLGPSGVERNEVGNEEALTDGQ